MHPSTEQMNPSHLRPIYLTPYLNSILLGGALQHSDAERPNSTRGCRVAEFASPKSEVGDSKDYRTACRQDTKRRRRSPGRGWSNTF